MPAHHGGFAALSMGFMEVVLGGVDLLLVENAKLLFV